MVKVYLGLGSNMEPKKHLRNGLSALNKQFGKLERSPAYESEAVGFDGDNFINLVVSIHTSLDLLALLQQLREIENNNGRDRSAPRFSGRTLDIDILTFGTLAGEFDGISLPRDEIFKNAFVLQPFNDLAPDFKVPGTQQTVSQLWQQFDNPGQKLWPVQFD